MDKITLQDAIEKIGSTDFVVRVEAPKEQIILYTHPEQFQKEVCDIHVKASNFLTLVTGIDFWIKENKITPFSISIFGITKRK